MACQEHCKIVSFVFIRYKVELDHAGSWMGRQTATILDFIPFISFILLYAFCD